MFSARSLSFISSGLAQEKSLIPRQAHRLNAVRFPSAVLNVPEPLYFSQNKMSCPEQSQRGFCAGLKSA